ncbi:hypothetical protein [Nonomuraea deserti]|uniref:hypothetical protein n=1 Tax=Nonomuraea deserti TaxID=1848322 RepID=UPI0015F2B7CF|nr:hypothetical protein [Nonomuraea deserti]
MTRAIVRAQTLLRAEPERATEVGERLFPPREAGLIAELVRRDAPYYDSRIPAGTARALVDFGRHCGLLDAPVGYDAVVAPEFRDLWLAPSRPWSRRPCRTFRPWDVNAGGDVERMWTSMRRSRAGEQRGDSPTGLSRGRCWSAS